MSKLLRLTFRNVALLAVLLCWGSTSLVPSPVSAASTNSVRLAPCAVKVKGQKQPKTLTKTETIGFQTSKQEDSTLAKGQTTIVQAGHTGKRLIIYTASYKNGKLTNCRHTGTKVTLQPVSQIIKVGSYVAPAVTTPPKATPTPAPAPSCTNGSYVNSAGNTVCSPEEAPYAPAGATAKCADGSYSFSQSRSGTCSHHGGVDTWL